MSVNTFADPPGQIENGSGQHDDRAEHDDADDLGVDVGDRLARRHAPHRHRGETGNRRQLGQVEDLEAGNLILRPEEQQRREREHPEVVPVVALADARRRPVAPTRAPALARRRGALLRGPPPPAVRRATIRC